MSEAERQQIERSWRSNASAWTSVVRSGRLESRRLATDAAMVDAVCALSPHRVLDLGCGEGWLSRALSAHGCECFGVDGSAALIEAAQALGGQFACADYRTIERDPRRWGRFDVVAANFALFEERLTPLLEALRLVLNEQGRLVLQTLHPSVSAGEEGYQDGWRLERFQAFGDEFAEPMPWFFRTLSSWWRLLVDAGYQVESLLEPAHPHSGQPLSLLLVARCSD